MYQNIVQREKSETENLAQLGSLILNRINPVTILLKPIFKILLWWNVNDLQITLLLS